MSSSEAELGARLAVTGREESSRRQWGQAALLGSLLGLFTAPGLGFPILSGGPRYALFAGVTVLWCGLLALLVRWLRRNLAVVEHERGLVIVRGPERTLVRADEVRRARYEPEAKRLELELTGGRVNLRLPPRLGRVAVEKLGALLKAGAAPARGALDGPSDQGAL